MRSTTKNNKNEMRQILGTDGNRKMEQILVDGGSNSRLYSNLVQYIVQIWFL